jgi:integrase
MASLVKKPTSKYWFACFRDKNGKQHRVSTQESRKSVAQKIADKYELCATRRTSRKRLWEVVNQLQEFVGGEETPSTTVREFFELWLGNRQAEGVTPSTYDAYKGVIERFLTFLGPRAAENLITITKRDIERFRNELVKTGLRPASTNKSVKILRRVFRLARLDGYIFDDPAETVGTIKGSPAKTRRAFSVDELRVVLAIADPEWQSLIKLGLYSGQRLGDLALLCWENVDLVGGQLQMVARKTGALLKLPLAGPLGEHVKSLDSSDDPRTPLHPKAYALVSSEGLVSALSNQFIGLLVEAGLRAPRSHESNGHGRGGPRTPSELSFHALRHTAVSLLKNAGVPHAIAQAIAGHESQAVSQQYTHVGDQALAEALTKFPTL